MFRISARRILYAETIYRPFTFTLRDVASKIFYSSYIYENLFFPLFKRILVSRFPLGISHKKKLEIS